LVIGVSVNEGIKLLDCLRCAFTIVLLGAGAVGMSVRARAGAGFAADPAQQSHVPVGLASDRAVAVCLGPFAHFSAAFVGHLASAMNLQSDRVMPLIRFKAIR
jgi:hypothetical protein